MLPSVLASRRFHGIVLCLYLCLYLCLGLLLQGHAWAVSAFVSPIASSHASFGIRHVLSSGEVASISLKSMVESANASADGLIAVEKYEYNGWKLTYRYIPPSPGYEAAEPLVLVHPVGVGLSSWFWEKFMASWKGGAVLAPNLIGCGLEDGNDRFDPDVRGMSVPLEWAKAIEALIQEKVITPASTTISCIIVVQGGLAPVGVLLAARNPESVVSKLVLTSPPTWDDMTTATPESELERNYQLYRSKTWGGLAFAVLESPWAVRLFSNLFLFLSECDDRWVELATSKDATTVEARPPIMMFNSGLLQHRSYEEELRELEQAVLVVSGSGDKRAQKRREFGSEMKYCTLTSIEGTNVLPWEAPKEVCEAIAFFSTYAVEQSSGETFSKK